MEDESIGTMDEWSIKVWWIQKFRGWLMSHIDAYSNMPNDQCHPRSPDLLPIDASPEWAYGLVTRGNLQETIGFPMEYRVPCTMSLKQSIDSGNLNSLLSGIDGPLSSMSYLFSKRGKCPVRKLLDCRRVVPFIINHHQSPLSTVINRY